MNAIETLELNGYTLNIYQGRMANESARMGRQYMHFVRSAAAPGLPLFRRRRKQRDALAAPVQIQVYCLDHSGIYIGPRNPGTNGTAG